MKALPRQSLMCAEVFSTTYDILKKDIFLLILLEIFNSVDLTSAVFYCACFDDVCICFYCGAEVFNWLFANVPKEEHFRHSLDCDHAKMVAQSRIRDDQ